MSILKRIFGKGETLEQREAEPSWSALSGMNAPAGGVVTPRMAENLATVLACTNAIADAIGSLPAYVFVKGQKGREVDHGHPVSRLIANGPNQWQTWPDFVSWLVPQALLRGNALAVIEADKRGAITGLKPVPWEWVAVQMLPSGRLVYDVTEVTSLYGGQGRMKRYLEGEVLHLRDRTDDGLLGKSRLQRASASLQAGMSVQDCVNSIYRNGINPSGALELDGKLNQEQREYLSKNFGEAFAGSGNTAKALVLDQGVKWKQVSISPEDTELLASRRFTTEELARIFGCPPPIIGDLSHGTFTNTVEVAKWFAQFTLGPWIRKIEAEFTRSVFSEHERITHGLEIDVSGFLRGDHAARWQGHEIAVRNQILTPNEVRECEGWNPRPGGDEFAQGAVKE